MQALSDSLGPGGGYTFNQLCGSLNALNVVHLAASPALYHGRVVNVSGLYRYEFETSALSFSDAPESAGLSVWLDYSPDCMILWADGSSRNREACTSDALGEVSRRWVILWGRFDQEEHGHMHLYHGGVGEVSLIEVVVQPEAD